MNRNEHLYKVSPEFQKYWESVCNEPYKALMEKMQAWGAWQEARKQILNKTQIKLLLAMAPHPNLMDDEEEVLYKHLQTLLETHEHK